MLYRNINGRMYEPLIGHNGLVWMKCMELPHGSVKRSTKKIKAAVMNFSGTLCDPFVIAPAAAFVETFRRHGINISWEEARKPMGLRKYLHIEAILKMPRVTKEWKKVHGEIAFVSNASRANVSRAHALDTLFADFKQIQTGILIKHSDIIPNVQPVVQELRTNGIKIGCTTGFTHEHAQLLNDHLRKNSCELDCFVAGDMVQNGVRPNPFMLFKNMEILNVPDVRTVVKCDDTVGGISEGINAGTWTVGIARWSNYMNISSMEEFHSLSGQEIQDRVNHSVKTLVDTGADFVINDIEDLPSVIEIINEQLALTDGIV